MTDKYEAPLPIHVLLQPEEKKVEIPRKTAKNVAQLHKVLSLRLGTALVVREGVLLTPDVALRPGDEVIVRKVMSSG